MTDVGRSTSVLEKFIEKLGDSLFFLRDRFSRLRPGRAGAASERVSMADRAKSIDWSVLKDRTKLLAAIRKHQLPIAIVLAVVVAAVLVPIAVKMLRNKPVAVEPMAYFYDLSTGKIFTRPITMAPPIAAPSGKLAPDGSLGGVRAHMMACGSCGGTDMQVVYLERFNPEIKAKLDAAIAKFGKPINQLSVAARRDLDISSDDAGEEISRVSTTPEWVRADSPEAELIVAEARNRCPEDAPPVVCLP